MTSPVSAIEAMPRRFSNDRNPSGLGYSNGIVEDGHGHYVLHSDYETLARKVEALERENEDLRKALKPLAAEADCWSSAYPDTFLVARTSKISLGTIRRARALLGGENAE